VEKAKRPMTYKPKHDHKKLMTVQKEVGEMIPKTLGQSRLSK
jgi:hypothetical protein